MIQYSLKCDQDHSFESWFQSGEAFDKLKAAGHVTCAVCGSGDVRKAIMAPRVTTARKKAAPVRPNDQAPSPRQDDMAKAMAEMRKQIEDNSTWVGKDFATEARSMYLGDTPERAIWGEANFEDAKSLIDDGVPVAPLPFGPKSKSN